MLLVLGFGTDRVDKILEFGSVRGVRVVVLVGGGVRSREGGGDVDDAGFGVEGGSRGK